MPFIEANIPIHTILPVMAALFAIASLVLAVYTLTNALRLRNVMLTWKEGKVNGFPLFATIFLGVTLALFGVAWFHGAADYYAIIGCYVIFGFNWVVSSYYMSKRYITDHGIVKNINDPSQTVAWKDIHDFVEQRQGSVYHFAFMYTNRRAGGLKNLNALRLELKVPAAKYQTFRKVLNHKLGRRFQHSVTDQAYFNKIDTDN